jgi:hypothetical protein
VACPEVDLPEDATVVPSDADMPECPHAWDSVAFSVGRESTVVNVGGQLDGPGRITNVPEFHDCQRFIVDEGDAVRYDSLFAIFATFRLADTDSLWTADSIAAAGGTPHGGFTGAEWLPGALILAWNDYDRLGIKTGFNCLYLYRGEGEGGDRKWLAEMVPFGVPSPEQPQPDCSSPLPPGSRAGTSLEVTEHVARLYPLAAYPAVARWDWTGRDQFIGIQCGRAWCEVGVDPAARSRSYLEVLVSNGNDPTGAPTNVRRRYQIKGWYDEQLLAYSPGAGAGPIPTGILARFFPEVELGDKNATDDFRPTPDRPWTLVGYVALDVPTGEPAAHVDQYRQKFGLFPTGSNVPFDRMNKVYLCNGTNTSCAINTVPPNCSGNDWWARVENPADTTFVEKCVTRRQHPSNFHIPGTVRLRWMLEDEGMWMRCIQGCCELIEE